MKNKDYDKREAKLRLGFLKNAIRDGREQDAYCEARLIVKLARKIAA
jgi:hypothetical protein